ncbi:MAG TPA: hypothetical protein VF184_07125 [Phycisphaeraceae bacterium]
MKALLCTLLTAVFLAASALAASPAAVRVHLEPVVDASSNLVDDAAWTFGRGYDPERAASFIARRDTDEFLSPPDSLFVEGTSLDYAGYWSQPLAVEPGATYFVAVRFKAENAKILIWMHGSAGKERFDERMYFLQGKPNFLVPVFLKPDCTGQGKAQDGWQILARSITVPEQMTAMSLNVGSYFGTGRIWFDDIYVGKGVPSLRLIVKGASNVAKVSVQMGSTNDVIFHADVDTAEAIWSAPVPDSPADASYIITTTLKDGTVLTSFYPVKEQILRR